MTGRPESEIWLIGAKWLRGAEQVSTRPTQRKENFDVGCPSTFDKSAESRKDPDVQPEVEVLQKD